MTTRLFEITDDSIIIADGGDHDANMVIFTTETCPDHSLEFVDETADGHPIVYGDPHALELLIEELSDSWNPNDSIIMHAREIKKN